MQGSPVLMWLVLVGAARLGYAGSAALYARREVTVG
jgi:hypothetical protein